MIFELRNFEKALVILRNGTWMQKKIENFDHVVWAMKI